MYQELLSLILSLPSLVMLNYVLQSVCFGYFISSFLVFLLKIINFAYADWLGHTSLIRIVAMLLFAYLKIWDSWFSFWIFVAYFLSSFFSLYVFDSGYLIAEKYQTKVRGHYTLQIFIFCTVGMFGLACIYKLCP